MSYTTLENTPIEIDLTVQANSNGALSWSLATHSRNVQQQSLEVW
jgi:hypothetical protein